MSKQRPQAIPNVQIDNDRVIVTEWRFSPGAETGWHRHNYDYTVVPQSTGKLLLETKEGESMAELVTGKSYFRNLGVEHNVVNTNSFDFAFIEIEIK
jgi:quercetin dioxygenase-like cupin family protein